MPETADPIDWDGERATRWIKQSAGLERQLAPVSTALFAALALRPGETVLDVGCGTGPTTREAARLVGPAGRVTGLDVSSDMISVAASVPVTGAAAIDWVVADAASWDAPAAAFDVVLSRFGVMFFGDPVAALSRLAAGTRPGGRLAFAVWGRRDASPLFEVPYRAALAARRACGEDVEELPAAGGPFSWSDDDAVAASFDAAGWRQVGVAKHTLRLPFAGGLSPRDAAAAALDFGPSRLILDGAAPEVVTAAQDAIEAAFAGRTNPAGLVELDAIVRIVTASR